MGKKAAWETTKKNIEKIIEKRTLRRTNTIKRHKTTLKNNNNNYNQKIQEGIAPI